MPEFETLGYELADGVVTLSLNRPGVLNSLNGQMMSELLQALDYCAASDMVGAVVLTGSGKAFCAGADLGQLVPENTPEARAACGEWVKEQMDAQFNRVITQLVELPKPVICAVNGIAAGGGVGLALSGDITLAAQSASFMQVFIPQLGIIPDMGCSWFLPRRLGNARAMGLMLTGEKLPAQQAEAWGLIWKALPDDELPAAAEVLARRLATGPTLGIAQLKKALAAAQLNSLPEQLDLEANIQRICCASEDFVEGVTAFIEKRNPRFKGR